MAIFGNFKGTTQPDFKIGKGGAKIHGTLFEPDANVSVAGDLWIDSANSTILTYENNAWVSIGTTLTDLNVANGLLTVDSGNATVNVDGTVAANTYIAGSTTVINSSGQWVGDPTNLQGTQGTQGITGSQGTQGTQGITGSQGTQGIQGITGAQGTQGTQGITGSQGTQGITGSQGTQGTQGITGAQGTQGRQGITGSQGTQGTQGITGAQGTQGRQGITGSQGTQGTQGTQGRQGITGAQGTDGQQGITGAQGTNGQQGITGAQGTQGITGSQGTQGITGSQGTQGIQGITGEGATVFTDTSSPTSPDPGTLWFDTDDATLNFYFDDGDSQQWTVVSGPTGSQGITGAQGTQGRQGITGTQGTTGPSTTINAANDTSATVHYPVFVAGTGNQTARIRTTATALSYQPSTGTLTAVLFSGTATSARYADLAERYYADDNYEPGTVMVLSGEKEITQSTMLEDHRVAGVISTQPAYMMNSDAGNNKTHPYLALVGRVPCKVFGTVKKGDLLISSDVPGRATVNNDAQAGRILGKALEDSEGERIIEILVTLM